MSQYWVPILSVVPHKLGHFEVVEIGIGSVHRPQQFSVKCWEDKVEIIHHYVTIELGNVKYAEYFDSITPHRTVFTLISCDATLLS